MSKYTFFLFIFSFSSISAQNVHLNRLMPSVEIDGQLLDFPFAGGLNSPQFSSVDFNNDGLEDIFAFDRIGYVSMAFLRQPDNSFVVSDEVLASFPQLYGWALLRDFDDDGVMDIFTYNKDFVSGIRVFKGRYESGNRLMFDPFVTGNTPNILFSSFPGISDTQIYVSEIDIPDINDIDCDGDLDILTFNIAGGLIEFYENKSIQNGHQQDSLEFSLQTNCYGGIFESGLTNSLDLSSQSGECASELVGEDIVQDRHTGSTLLSLDEDGDGDKDLILGDLSFGNLNMSINANSCTEAWMNEQDINFPSYDTPVDLPIFPAAFYLDVNGDGKRDLVAAPNPDANGIDFENVWYYRNQGTDSNPQFTLEQNDFLVGQMIEMGTGARPAILDYNADGLMDLVIGNSSYFELLGVKNARLLLFENVGTSQQPAYRLVEEDFLGMNQFSTTSFRFAPYFGDLDNDGDMDALVGEIGGKLFFAENLAGANNPVFFATPVYDYMGIDIGQASVPQIVDLNRDGLADIVLGEKGGNINYFQNVGTSSIPNFGDDEEILPNIKRLGEVDTRIPGFTTGYSSPQFVDFMGQYRLYVGTQFGPIEIYGDIEGNLEGGAFEQLSESMANLNEGYHIHPLLFDRNGDDFLDLIVGNNRGGLSYFSTNILIDGMVNIDEVKNMTLNVFPNPVKNIFTISLPIKGSFDIRLYDALGRLALSTHAQGSSIILEKKNFASGVYFLHCKIENEVFIQKIIFQ